MRITGSTGRIEHLRVGDLTVDGTNTVINTSTLSVEDNIIELNRNISSNAGMPSFTGLKVNRGETSSATEQNLYWVWDETFADDGRPLMETQVVPGQHSNQVVDKTSYQHPRR